MTFWKTFNEDWLTYFNQRDSKNEIESGSISGCFSRPGIFSVGPVNRVYNRLRKVDFQAHEDVVLRFQPLDHLG